MPSQSASNAVLVDEEMTYASEIPINLDNPHDKFSFPKAELHCHLDGSFRIETIIELAKKRGIPLPSYDPNVLISKYCIRNRKKNLDEYLKCFATFVPAFAGCKESIARITREAIEDKAKNGVRYIEFRYSPQLLANCDVSPTIHCKEKGDLTPRDVVDTVCKASILTQRDFNIEVRFILCCIISFPGWSMEVARLCEEFADHGVVGMDIAGAGDEEGKEILEHKDAFDFCEEHGIHVTAHAGESGCAKEVQRAMDILRAKRIGHGYHVVKDDSIYEEAKMKNIHFEVCPLSSYLTSSVDADLTQHPAIRFLKDKVNFSLNTDDGGVQHSTLFDDYEIANSKFNFSIWEIKRLNLNALQAAFCDDALKKRLLEEFEAVYKLGTHF